MFDGGAFSSSFNPLACGDYPESDSWERVNLIADKMNMDGVKAALEREKKEKFFDGRAEKIIQELLSKKQDDQESGAQSRRKNTYRGGRDFEADLRGWEKKEEKSVHDQESGAQSRRKNTYRGGLDVDADAWGI